MPVSGPTRGLPEVEAPWPDARRCALGPLGVDVSSHGFRNLAVGGEVVIRELYPAVRAVDWSTLEATDVGRHISEREVTLTQRLGRDCTAVTRLELTAELTVVVQHRLSVYADTLVNRWGLTLCLDAQAWAGAGVAVGGHRDELPAEIGPQRLVDGRLQAMFPASTTLELWHGSGGRLRVQSVEQELEIEDQRNWTDPTYKIYSGPLAAPRPVLLAAGTTSRQELRVRWQPSNRSGPAHAPADEAVLLSCERQLPQIGVQLNETAGARPTDLTPVLDDLGVDHVRLDTERPSAASVLAALPPIEVELAALTRGREPEADQHEVLALAARAPAGVRVLWHREGRGTTGRAETARLPSVLGQRPLEVVPGTDAYFADLNRDRPDVGDAVSFSISPTVHTRDSETVFASLATQAEVVAQARSLLAARVLVSPVTYGVRGAPETSHDAAHRSSDPVADPRLATLEGAAWTLGSVHALLWGGADSGTWHELVGEAGLVGSDQGGPVVRPTFHALAALQSRSRPRVRAVNAPGAAWVALHLLDLDRLVAVSLRPWPQAVAPTLWGGGMPVRRRRLREGDVAAAARTRRWWAAAEEEHLPADESLELDAFEVTVLDLAPG